MYYQPFDLLLYSLGVVLVFVVAYYTGINPTYIFGTIGTGYVLWLIYYLLFDAFKNPSLKWEKVDSTPELVFNLDERSLNGIQVGNKVDMLYFLGPSPTGASRYIYYDHLGLRFWLSSKKKLEAFSVNDEYPNDSSFCGSILIDGQKAAMHELTPELIQAHLGNPAKNQKGYQGYLIVYFYEHEELQLLYDPSDHLQMIKVSQSKPD